MNVIVSCVNVHHFHVLSGCDGQYYLETDKSRRRSLNIQWFLLIYHQFALFSLSLSRHFKVIQAQAVVKMIFLIGLV